MTKFVGYQNKARSYSCNICGKSFFLESNLASHSRIHIGVKPHSSSICGKTFTQEANLTSHSRIHTRVKPHSCSICGKSFVAKSSLEAHSFNHNGIKPYSCSICGKSFNRKFNLKSHTFTHKGIKPHSCSICGKSFVAKSSLEVHSLIHSGVRPHSCSICGRTFTTKQTLTRHSLIHEKVKSHSCSICGKSFTCKANLTRHSVIHKVFKAQSCKDGRNEIEGTDIDLDRIKEEHKIEDSISMEEESDKDNFDWIKEEYDIDSCDIVKEEHDIDSCDIVKEEYDTDSCDIVKEEHDIDSCDIVKEEHDIDSCDIYKEEYDIDSGDIVKEDHDIDSCDIVKEEHDIDSCDIVKEEHDIDSCDIYKEEYDIDSGDIVKERLSYTIAFKLKVVQFSKVNGNRAAAREFGKPISESMVRYWRKQEEKLNQSEKTMKNIRKPEEAKWKDLEKEMVDWITNQRSFGRAMSTTMIITEAKALAVARGSDDFLGTRSWCFRFMKRNGIAMRAQTHISPRMPDEYKEKIVEFHKYVLKLRSETDYELSQIGKMNEVPLIFDVPSNKRVHLKGAKTVDIQTTGNEKNYYTVVLSCCADGTKLPPMLIFKRKTIPKEVIPQGIIIHVHEVGWIDENGMKIWLEKVWANRLGGLLKKPSLLVWDQLRGHLTDATKKRVKQLNTQLAVIPGGLTGQLHPLDVSISKPFKSFMHEEWDKWMASDDQHTHTPTGKIRKPTIAQVSQWVKRSWDAVKIENVTKSFKKCGISNALDATEDDMLFEGGDSDDSSSTLDLDNPDDPFALFDESDAEVDVSF